MIYHLHQQCSQLIGACASGEWYYLESAQETAERHREVNREKAQMRNEWQQIPSHFVVESAELRRLVKGAIHGLNELFNLMRDDVFKELKEALRMVHHRQPLPADHFGERSYAEGHEGHFYESEVETVSNLVELFHF